MGPKECRKGNARRKRQGLPESLKKDIVRKKRLTRTKGKWGGKRNKKVFRTKRRKTKKAGGGERKEGPGTEWGSSRLLDLLRSKCLGPSSPDFEVKRQGTGDQGTKEGRLKVTLRRRCYKGAAGEDEFRERKARGRLLSKNGKKELRKGQRKGRLEEKVYQKTCKRREKGKKERKKNEGNSEKLGSYLNRNNGEVSRWKTRPCRRNQNQKGKKGGKVRLVEKGNQESKGGKASKAQLPLEMETGGPGSRGKIRGIGAWKGVWGSRGG